MPTAGYVELTLMFEREGNKWVATCLELGTSTYGKTLERVEDSIHQLVIEHLNLLEEAEEQQRFFEEHGITFHSHLRPQPHEFLIRVPTDRPSAARRPFFQPNIFQVPSAARRRLPAKHLSGAAD